MDEQEKVPEEKSEQASGELNEGATTDRRGYSRRAEGGAAVVLRRLAEQEKNSLVPTDDVCVSGGDSTEAPAALLINGSH